MSALRDSERNNYPNRNDWFLEISDHYLLQYGIVISFQVPYAIIVNKDSSEHDYEILNM